MMKTANEAFLSAVQNFPKWMDIRKRPGKSVGGLYLRAILDEQVGIQKALDQYVRDFFLLSYIGREDEIIDYAETALIGSIDLGQLEAEGGILVTEDAHTFLHQRDAYALYQEDCIILAPELAPKDHIFRYVYHGVPYAVTLQRQHIWNIIDEFAMMSGIERQVDETNAQLMKRCFLAFSNPTNSTETGIKHAIENAMTNYVELKDEDIVIEKPDTDNMNAEDEEYGTVYERLAQLNQDIYRTKKWDLTTWEHGFRELGYLPNVWDTKLPVYQDGVGQMDDLKVRMSGDDGTATTRVEVTGYAASPVLVDQYIRRQNVKREIPLRLMKYNDELQSKDIHYRITASEVEPIDPFHIYFKSAQKVSGPARHYLSDILLDTDGLTVTSRGNLEPDAEYLLRFLPKSPYSSMKIYKADMTKGRKKTNLLKEHSIFREKNGVFQNVNVAANIATLDGLKDYTNIIEAAGGGFTLGGESTAGELVMDVTGMDGKILNLPLTCQMVNQTTNRNFVHGTDGFEICDTNTWVAADPDGGGTLVIDIECNDIEFTIPQDPDPSSQGSFTIYYSIDGADQPAPKQGEPDASGFFFHRSVRRTSKFHIEITRSGKNPLYVQDIHAASYSLTCWTDNELGRDITTTTFSTVLPDVGGRKNTLHVKLEAYTNFAPVLQCIHVGAQVSNAVYEIPDICTDSKGGTLDILTDCLVELYRVTEDGLELLDGDYHTQSVYANNTPDDIYAEIDTSSLLSISSASLEIHRTVKNGRVVSYVVIEHGTSATDIVIDGTSYVVKERRALADILGIKRSEKVYVSTGVKGFLVKRSSGKEEILRIHRRDVIPDADSFAYEGELPEKTEACFIINEEDNITAHTTSFDRNFETTYLTTADKQQYVAYNSHKVYQENVSGVSIVNTFAPLLDMNKLLYFELSYDKADGIEVSFTKPYGRTSEQAGWSLGQKEAGIHIHVGVDFNNASEYAVDANQMTEAFAISNNIALRDSYIVNGTETQLGRYIVTPPDDMQIIYESVKVGEYIFPKDDGFNKLYYSNVIAIQSIMTEAGDIIPSSDYALIPEAGIITWNSKQYTGENAKQVAVLYDYKRPKYLAYKDLNSLYEIVGYSTDAYEKINEEPIVLENMADGDEETISFGERVKADKIVLHCENANFVATLEGNKVRTTLVGKDNTAVVHTGYYYDDGEEYYFFEHVNTEVLDKMSHVEMHYVRHAGDTLKFIQESINHVLDSRMLGNGTDHTLCDVDFHKGQVRGISSLNALTACDTFQEWQTFSMEVSLAEAWNGLGLQLTQTDNGYALLDITRAADNGSMITLHASEGLELSVLREVLADGDPMTRSVFAEPYGTFTREGDLATYIFGEDTSPDYRYYLYVYGSGVIDDIVACYAKDEPDAARAHTRNLSALGFRIQEKPASEYEHAFRLSPLGMEFNGLEADASGAISTGSNVDWGVTRVYSLHDETDEPPTAFNLIARHGAYYSTDREGSLLTPKIFLSNKDSLLMVYVKVNDVLVDEFRNFDIHILTGSEQNAPFHEVSLEEQVNFAAVPASRLGSYLQVEVDSPAQRVIENVEVYVKYAETDNGTLHVMRNTFGTLKTKVFDATYQADFQPVRVEGTLIQEADMRLFVRGLRRGGGNEAWTKWYECELKDGAIVDGHIFEGYRYFQFELALYSSGAQAGIESIVFKVVD